MEADSIHKKGHPGRSMVSRKVNEKMKMLLSMFIACVFGFFVGMSFPDFATTKLSIKSSLPCTFPNFVEKNNTGSGQNNTISLTQPAAIKKGSNEAQNGTDSFKVFFDRSPFTMDFIVFRRVLWGEKCVLGGFLVELFNIEEEDRCCGFLHTFWPFFDMTEGDFGFGVKRRLVELGERSS